MNSSPRRAPRLFVEHDLDGESVELDEREAHYLGHVLRLKAGDELIAFDGHGTERHASVASLHRRGAILALNEQRTPLGESPLDLTLVQALPKSDAMDLIVQKVTELGARALVPVHTEFSVVRLDAERGERRLEHWRKVSQSACEQCGRHRPLRIEPAVSLADALTGLPPSTARFVLDPTAAQRLPSCERPTAGLVVAIGPEGGFGPSDLRRLQAAGFERATLGRRVLRVESAAIAVCAIVQALWGDL